MLGYSPADKYALAKEAKKQGYEDKYLLATGLCYETDKHAVHDRFWGRAMFPVRTVSGRVVAFGGRVLDAATKGVERKYVNSPEEILYLIEKRKEAKKNKDFELADSIRNELLEKGIIIKDTREGTTYEIQ